MALLPRVRHAHPRLQSSSAPLGPPSSSPFRCKIAGATLSLPSSRQHVVVVPRFPCLCRCNASAGPPSPSPSRQHVAVIPPSPCLHLYRHSVKLPAPQGSHYSVTAGERSEPAEGACPHHHRPQGGRTLIVCACESCAGIPRVTALHQPAAVAGFAERMPVRPPWGRTYICGSPSAGEHGEPAEGTCPIIIGPKGVERSSCVCVCVVYRHPSGGSSPPAYCCGWLCRPYACSTPLGPYIYIWLSFRGFAMLTRGYRVVRPPWGRRPRRHSAAKSRERRRPCRHSAACRCGTALPMPTSVQRICETAGPAGVALLCNRG